MAVKRKRWDCPTCGSSWEIPEGASGPHRCPKCPVQKLPDPTTDFPTVQWVPSKAPPNSLGRVFLALGLCGLTIALSAVLFRFYFQEQYRLDVAESPILAFSPQIPLRDTITATLLMCVAVVPMGIAIVRQHQYRVPISILSVFASWTCIGWVAAMMWACWPRKQ